LNDISPASEPDKKVDKRKFAADIFGSSLDYLEPIEYLVDGHLELGTLNVLFGDPGSCKSFYAIGIAACVACGVKWYGNVTKQGPVLYVAGEGQRGIKRRFAAYARHHGLDLSSVPLYISRGAAQMMDKKAYQELKQFCKELKPALVVLDTVARNFGSGDENSTSDMNLFVARADRLGGPDCVRLAVHHSGKANKGLGRGSSVLKAAADTEWRAEEVKNGHIEIEQMKAKDTERRSRHAYSKIPVQLAVMDDGSIVDSIILEDRGSVECEGDIGSQPDEFVKDVIKEMLLSGKTYREIVDAVGINLREVSRLTDELIKDKTIRRVGGRKDGVWTDK